MSEPGQRADPDRGVGQRFRALRLGGASPWFLAVVVFLSVVGPWFLAYGPETFAGRQFEPPSWHHPFGTDVHGRDLLARVLQGTRLSLLVGAMGAAVSLVLGVSWGAVAGYVGGRLDGWMMRAVDILYSLPTVILVMVAMTFIDGLLDRAAVAGQAPANPELVRLTGLFLGLGAVSWLTMARIVRGEVVALRGRPFVVASRALGATHGRILRRHILPNITGVVIVYLALTVPGIMIYESFLSFLGLGIQPPQASLGSLIAEGALQINPIRIYWWMIVFPAAVLTSVLIALNLLGDRLRDALHKGIG